MDDINVQSREQINFEFSRFRLPQYVNEFRPAVYLINKVYYAVLGTDLQTGICGTGETPEDALISWNDNLLAGLRNPDLSNPSMHFVLDTMKALRQEI
ncbi:hypothetical protein [Pedobacter aquatilis]|uniref:hypothetical protein n=1 Tax=Pedobacter aquatilis TaxID=351343 RepID=UPI00292CEAA3|nr:hypothetical protein [Pedobacter aquatilis]